MVDERVRVSLIRKTRPAYKQHRHRRFVDTFHIYIFNLAHYTSFLDTHGLLVILFSLHLPLVLDFPLSPVSEE